MNLAKVVTDCVTLESDVLALGTDPAAVKVATDVAALLSDFGLDNSLHTLGGPFDRFQDFTAAIAQYRAGALDSAGLVDTLGAARIGRTPNPQRICTAIAFANIIGPIVMSMMQPPGHWTPIPLPPFCTAPTPTGAPAGSVDSGELQRMTHAVLAGMFA